MENIDKEVLGIPLAAFGSGFPLQSSRYAGRIFTSIPNAEESLHTLVASALSHPTKANLLQQNAGSRASKNKTNCFANTTK